MKTSLAIIRDEERRLYIAVPACCIHPVLLCIDGIRHHRFHGNPHVYISLDDAIAWHQNEAQHTRDKKRQAKQQEIITDLITIRDRLSSIASEN